MTANPLFRLPRLLTLAAMALVILIGMLSAAPALPPANAAQITATPMPFVPRFVPGPCPIAFPAGLNILCGKLVVPEDRSAATPKLIRVAVGIGKATGGARQGDPVFYLHGGPGLAVLGRVRWWPLTPFRVDRDVIVMDQRGTGFSEPALNCPEMADIPFRTLTEDTAPPAAAAYHAQQANRCADRLAQSGIDLRFYTNREVAQDIEDLRVALGYGPIDLFAWSAGTRAALTMLRLYPASVRAAILDSVFMPPGIPYYTELAPNAQKTFEALFGACAANSACAAAYPDLPRAFAETVDRLKTEPARFAVRDPITGQVAQAAMNGYGFVGLLYRLMYESYRLGSIPRLIMAVHDGDYSLLPDLLAAPLAEPEQYAVGMNHSIHCAEEAPFNDPAAFDRAWSATDPHYLGFYHWDVDPAAFRTLCAAWPRRAPDPADNAPVRSDVPTLILSGALDPASPPAHAAFAAQTLPRSTLLSFPTLSHFVWEYGGDCPKQIALGFLNDLARRPDDSCIAALPAIVFEEPGGGGLAASLTPRRLLAIGAVVGAALLALGLLGGIIRRRGRKNRIQASGVRFQGRGIRFKA